MAESVVSFVVERVGEFLIQEAKFLGGVRGQVENMQTELKQMQRFLKDADKRQDEEERVKGWVSDIREVAYDAENVIETFALEIASRSQRGFRNKCKRYASIFIEGAKLHKVGNEIEAIKTRITNLTESLQKYGIRIKDEGEGSSSVFRRQRELRRTFSHLAEEHTVGLERNTEILVSQLVTKEKQCQVVSICGMGGLGKTTLANKVYHHDEVMRHFDGFAWAYISQQFQPRDIWEGILLKLSPKGKREEILKLRDDELAKELYQVQQKEKCLVILDDIWRCEAWDALKHAFPIGKTTSSKILLTTRNKLVALHVNPKGILEPLCLTEDESWELLQKKACSGNDYPDSRINMDMEELGRKMVRRCDGLPLAINVLGGILETTDSFDEWEKIHKNIDLYLERGLGDDHEQENSGIHGVLALSYHELPYRLKPLFLYFGHFPEDCEISTKKLFRLWVAEGFVPQKQYEVEDKETMEELAEHYLHELINRCMVQVGVVGSRGRIKTCRVHDLMRDLCLFKANEENFLQIVHAQIGNMQVASSKARRLAVYADQYCDPMYYAGTPNLRSLYFFSMYKYETPLEKSVTSAYTCFKLLRMLTFDQRILNGEKLMKEIGSLLHLRYLAIEDCHKTTLPSSIGNLRYLQTLIVKSSYESVSIPNVLWKLERLRHLNLKCRPIVIPSGKLLQLGNLRNLQTLQGFDTTIFDIKELVNFPNLRKLRMKCSNFEELEAVLQLPGFRFNHLSSLHIVVRSGFHEADLKILFYCCHHVYKLHLKGHIRKLPEHHHFPPNLTKLTFSDTRFHEDPMATLEKLPKLSFLYFKVDALFKNAIVCSSEGFPRLKTLIFEEWMENFLEEWHVEKGAMPSLCQLRFIGCYELKMIPDGLRHITTLRELNVKSMTHAFLNRLRVANGEGEGGEDFDKVKHVPSIVFN